MQNRLGAYWIPVGTFALAMVMSILVGSNFSTAKARIPRQQSKPGEPEHKLKVPPTDRSDDNGFARGTAQVKPSSAGTVDNFTVNNVTLSITANDGSTTTEDVTHAANLTSSGLGSDLAAYKIEMTSTWNALGGAVLVGANIKSASYSFTVTADFTVNGLPASIPKTGTGALKIVPPK